MHEKRSAVAFNDGSEKVIAAMIEVHRVLGPGLMEDAYEACLLRELELRGMKVARQVQVPVVYKGLCVASAYRMDLVVNERFVIEIKCVESLRDIHIAQLITYLKLSNYPVGLLVNFNSRLLKDGLRRFKNIAHFIAPDPSARRDVEELERG